MRRKFFGFTLAEVLIVIGIIGVVAALTLPNLNHATGDKEKVTKVKKIYSTLTEALDRAQAIYGPFDTWFKDLRNSNEYINRAAENELFAKRVTEFLKISKDCGFGEGCFSSAPFLAIDGNEIIGSYLEEIQGTTYMVMLPDGVSIGFNDNGQDFVKKIRVDIDGPNKGKNQDGNDIFDFTIRIDDVDSENQLYPSINYDGESIYQYSTKWVIENGNLDYLKCPEELNWETKTSCE